MFGQLKKNNNNKKSKNMWLGTSYKYTYYNTYYLYILLFIIGISPRCFNYISFYNLINIIYK